jgi:peptidoglycan/xylan/chitin deacetylase (PgdA/CDA1 family)
MYHAFGKPEETSSRFVLPIQRFAQQMAWLKRLRYCVISLEEFQRHLTNGNMPPARSVVITIDDGYAELYTSVYPILKSYGFPATIFIVTSKVGESNDWTTRKEMSGRSLLSWSEIRTMSEDGIRFGAHSRSHAKLPELSEDQLKEEIVGSKLDLESMLNTPITTFAYPYGEYDVRVQSILSNNGFASGCSANVGLNPHVSPMFALNRIEIAGTISLPRFLLALWLGSV